MLSLLFFLGIAGSLIIALRTPPTWIVENEKIQAWRKVNIIAAIASLLSFAPILFYSFSNYYIFLFSGLGFLVYTFIVTLYTDFKFRLADRRLLNLLIVCSLGLAAFVFSFLDEPNKIVYIMITLLAMSTIFIPIFGASDGRALTLGTILIYPIGELKYYTIALIILAVLATVYAIFFKVKYKAKKSSIPAVPFFSLAFTTALVLTLV